MGNLAAPDCSNERESGKTDPSIPRNSRHGPQQNADHNCRQYCQRPQILEGKSGRAIEFDGFGDLARLELNDSLYLILDCSLDDILCAVNISTDTPDRIVFSSRNRLQCGELCYLVNVVYNLLEALKSHTSPIKYCMRGSSSSCSISSCFTHP